jgi:intraflagellar transport protein 74
MRFSLGISLLLQRQLADNETHVQLSNLEKKWSHLEQNNFALAEFVASKKAELNFAPARARVLKQQWDYNKMIIEQAKSMTNTTKG